MSAESSACPGCDGPISRGAALCRICRRRAIAVGVQQVLEPPPADPRSPTQNSAFHGKCSTLATIELGASATAAQIAVFATRRKREALEWASTRFCRAIESSKELSRDEMSEVLDELDAQIESESTAL